MVKKMLCVFMLACMVVVAGVASASAADYETINLTIHWDYDLPPDMNRYEIRCTANDADIQPIALDAVVSEDPDSSPPKWNWTGDVKATAGKADCYLRAVDLAEQVSPWSDPATFDPAPGKVHVISISVNTGN